MSADGANQQASPAAAAVENSPTEKKTKRRKRICAFVRRKWQEFKSTVFCCSRGNKVSSPWPQPDSDPDPSGLKAAECQDSDDYLDPDDPRPGPCRLKAAECQDSDDYLDPDDPRPGPCRLKAAECQDSDDPQPGSANLEPATHPDDPQPGPSGLEPTQDTDLADPEPAKEDPQPGLFEMEASDCWDSDDPLYPEDPKPVPSGMEASNCQDSDDPLEQFSSNSVLEGHGPAKFSSNPDQTHLSKLIEVYWNTRRSQVGEFDQGWSETLQDSGPPGPSLRKTAQDPDDPRPGPCRLKAAECQDSDDPQPGSSNLEPATHPDDPQPGPSGLEPTQDTDLADPEPAKGQFYFLYEVGEMLGAGSFGKVYKGTRIYDGKQVAIKFLRKRSAERLYRAPDSPKPLFAEVALNLLLQKAPRSQHVLQMYQWFDEPKRRILILEHPQPCETLREFIWNKGGCLDETLACRLMRQAVLAFKHCLDRGVYHNDIKMDNILVNIETLQLKLIDFGCGFLLKHAYEDNQGRLSQRKPHTDAQTVLSLGLILYRMVNGLHTVVSDFDNLKFEVNVSKECSDWISQCLKRDKTKRATLEQLLGHEWFQQVDGSKAAQERRSIPASI